MTAPAPSATRFHPPAARFRPSARLTAASRRSGRSLSAARHRRIGVHRPFSPPDPHPAARLRGGVTSTRLAQVLIPVPIQRSPPVSAPSVSRAAPSSGPLAGCLASSPAAAPTPLGPGPTPPPPPRSVPGAPADAWNLPRLHPLRKIGDSREGRDGARWDPLLKKIGGREIRGWDPVSPLGANQGELELEKSEPVMEWKATAPVSGCPRSPPASR